MNLRITDVTADVINMKIMASVARKGVLWSGTIPLNERKPVSKTERININIIKQTSEEYPKGRLMIHSSIY